MKQALHHRPRARQLASALSALALMTPLAALAAEAGEIRFVIGQASIITPAGDARAAAAGARISAGERIETGPGGHVHLRMVDGAFLSVRPGSRFVIEQYDTDAANTAIRFKLEQGVLRSITGEAARVHKDRFRLNTPLAAIGVRGTDFVVQADTDSLRAVVNQGTIVVAPIGSGCLVQSLGPCSTTSARELSDTMGRVLLELNGIQPARIVPLNNKAPDTTAPPVPQESVYRQALAASLETTGVDKARPAITPPQPSAPQPAPEPVPVVPPSPPIAPAPPPVPATPPAPTEAPTPALLQWGRWADAPARPGDTQSATYSAASEGRKPTVGDGYVALLRNVSDTQVLSTTLGQGDFALTGGQVALLHTNGSISPGSINGGWLRIDFNQRNFATSLNLNHPTTGAVLLESGGRVRDDGIFAVVRSDSRVAGAVTMDGTQAGYLFDKSVPQGTLSGTTLWKR